MGIFIQLFLSFFKIGAFSFGGGYAMLPLLEKEVIETHQWMNTTEFVDIFAISEMTPGPIAVNSATFLGHKVAGIPGAAVATFAVILPSFIVISLIFISLNKFKNSPYVDWIFQGIRPVVLGLIAAAGVTVAQTSFLDYKSVLIGALLFYLVSFKKFNPIWGIVLAGVLGVVLY
ncbi:MAG TPA: chromate transporter [Tissierellaceae bacterium]|nr:chromate transporter [Tissierellaceae bacterium]